MPPVGRGRGGRGGVVSGGSPQLGDGVARRGRGGYTTKTVPKNIEVTPDPVPEPEVEQESVTVEEHIVEECTNGDGVEEHEEEEQAEGGDAVVGWEDGEEDQEGAEEEEMEGEGEYLEWEGEDEGDEVEVEEEHGEGEEEEHVEGEEQVEEEEEHVEGEQAEDYEVLDEVAGDDSVANTSQKDEAGAAASGATSKSSKRTSAEREEDRKKRDEEKKKRQEEDRKRGFVPSKFMLQRETKKFNQESTLYVSPVTPADLMRPEIVALTEKAIFCNSKMTQVEGAMCGFLEIRFGSKLVTKESMGLVKELLPEVEAIIIDTQAKADAGWALHKKYTAPIDYCEAKTVALFGIPKDCTREMISSLVDGATKVMIPVNKENANRGYAFVEVESAESVTALVEVCTLDINGAESRYMAITAPPQINTLVQKLEKTKLQEKIYAPLPTGLQHYYEDLQETLFYYINWADPSELGSHSRAKLQKFQHQLSHKVFMSEKMAERKAVQKNAAEERKKKNDEERRQRDEERKARREKEAAERKEKGEDKAVEKEGEKKDAEKKDKRDGDRKKGESRSVSKGRRDDRSKIRRDDRPSRFGPRDPPRRDNKRPMNRDRSYERGGKMGRYGNSGDQYGQQMGVPMGGTLNAMMGLPNNNRTQINMMQLGMAAPLVGLASGMGPGGAGGMYGREREDFNDRGSGGMPYGGPSQAPEKAENAINLLLGLSKMLKGNANPEPMAQGGGPSPGHRRDYEQQSREGGRGGRGGQGRW